MTSSARSQTRSSISCT